MSDEDLKKTVKIPRPARVRTDERGQSVWEGTVNTAKLELVSTAKLKQIIDSDDEVRKQKLREASEGIDGMLAHDPDSDAFEIVSDEDLQAALEQASGQPTPTRDSDVVYEPPTDIEQLDEELSLVSTQVLRAMLNPPDDAGKSPADGNNPLLDDDDGGGGFDPYNSS